ncbi:DnaB-like helicase N-terminal domain-containing protein [Nostoc favosum]|uniref:AAA family ATPase n=1 Tax=Nostoc favosum CHAB5714 TaxID=2780399 RepID=A0ABS8I2D1_9NOSO|nr:DnaB-like helicase N-terminal domain-containing protein [Nostoc favosum]MCC5597964.1 AAA family ATPase [Nostoc favosum CHAB5714]
MTQGTCSFPQAQIDFSNNVDKLPPCEIGAEEAILGGILLDPNAIYRVEDRLKPEHFYISAHRDIYAACLRLSKTKNPTDLLSVTSFLSRHGILARTGGQNKLATLVDRTVSAINIDAMANSVIEAFVHREIIALGNNIIHLGYQTEREIPDLLAEVTERTRSIIEVPIGATRDEYEQCYHDTLLSELKHIYTTCGSPSLRLIKLRLMAKKHKEQIEFLERVYMRSLTDQCSELLTYQELKELAGSTVREWLQNGLIPKHTTILLSSDGGIGKTKYAYGLGKFLIQGKQFGPFHVTGEKRRILYYQGDESPGDMMQALESLGYSENDIGKYVKVRIGWSAENMAALLEDLKEFQPDLVVIDSLSTANRHSIYREGEMEYARPILEMAGLANEYKTTFLLIHHNNKIGEVRGTTAIRNSVSEVWKLSKDNSNTATPHDRIFEIDKSRSRSSGKKYRLMFNPEDLSFTFLGEEGAELSGPNHSAKEATLELLASHRNINFTSEEIAHRLNISKPYARRYLTELASDGLVSVNRPPGKAYTYFLAYEKGSPKDHPSDHPCSSPITIASNQSQPELDIGIKKLGSPKDHPLDHLQEACLTSDTAKGDPRPPENGEKISRVGLENILENQGVQDHLCSNVLPGNNPGGDPGGDPNFFIHNLQTVVEVLPVNGSSSFPQGDPGGDPSGDPLPLLQEKGTYWSVSFKREVEVFQIFDEMSEVSCQVPGRGRRSLPFTDLQSCQQSPKHNFYVGDQVVILVGKLIETFATITDIRSDGIWLKSDDRKKRLARPYFPHQLVKA